MHQRSIKLSIANLATIISLLLLAVSIIVEKTVLVGNLKETRQNQETSIAVDDLAHELQKERGISFAILDGEASGGLEQELSKQQSRTNRSLNQLSQRYHDQAGPIQKFVQQMESRITHLRQSVDQHESSDQVFEDYSNLVARCLYESSLMSRAIAGSQGTRNALAYQMLSEAKESAGKERAIVTAALTTGGLADSRRTLLKQVLDQQEYQFQTAKMLLDAEQQKQLDKLLASSILQEPKEQTGRLVDGQSPSTPVSVEQRWNLHTRKLDAIRQFQERLAASTTREASVQATIAIRIRWLAVFLSILPICTYLYTAFSNRKFNLQLNRSIEQVENRASAMFQQSHEAILVMKDETIVDCNQAAIDLLATGDKRQIVGQSPLDWRYNADRQSALWRRMLKRANHRSAARVDIRLEASDGRHLTVEASLSRIDSRSGEPTYMLIMRDLTRRLEMEEELMNARRLESLGALSAGIAHEINTPMQCVFSNVEFLQSAIDQVLQLDDDCLKLIQDPASSSDVGSILERQADTLQKNRENLSQAVQDAADASGRVIRIVRAMNAMSHHGVEKKEAASLNKIAEDAITISTNRWKYAAQMKTEFAADLKSIALQSTQMGQVVLNLVVNAADAITDRFGPDCADQGVIRVSTLNRKEGIVLTVEDNGSGIPDEIKNRIFDPFFTTKEVGKGSGQGLSLVHAYVTQHHGGKIKVDSTPDVGTRISIWLPESTSRPAIDPSGKQLVSQ